MNSDFEQKVEYLKWLESIGIGYYLSEEGARESLDANVTHKQSKARHGKPQNYQIAKDSQISRNGLPCSPLETPLGSDAPLDLVSSLSELKTMVEKFDGCALKNFATNTVFADGNPKARIMLVGEAPGAKEDERGIPFCGESGMLLDTMLLTIGLSRQENVYITNTIFWRPPANRRPTKEEMDACRPFLEKHIALINPELIICVGSTAVTGLLGDKITIGMARNNTYLYNNKYLTKPVQTMSIFHPAYLLRQSEKKKDTWFDLLKVQQFIQENLKSTI